MTSLPHDHLDDEALSAVLDGEATPDETAHTASCAECGARLAALRAASMLVRSPVEPAPGAQRDAAIAAALAAAPSNVVSLASRRRGLPAWLGAAAAVVVAVVAIGVVAGGADDDDRSSDVASGGAGGDTTTEMAADDAGDTFATLVAEPADGGDLGAIEDVDLQLAVDGALARREVAETTVADADEESDGGEDEAATETTIASAAGSAPAADGCEDPVRAGDPELGALVYRATGTYDDEPAVVLGFDVVREDGGVDRRVYVLAVEGCAIRLAETYSA